MQAQAALSSAGAADPQYFMGSIRSSRLEWSQFWMYPRALKSPQSRLNGPANRFSGKGVCPEEGGNLGAQGAADILGIPAGKLWPYDQRVDEHVSLQSGTVTQIHR